MEGNFIEQFKGSWYFQLWLGKIYFRHMDSYFATIERKTTALVETSTQISTMWTKLQGSKTENT